MITLEDLQNGIRIDYVWIKIDCDGLTKIIIFNKGIQPNVSTMSSLFYINDPKMWELKDANTSVKEFVLIVNLIIKDLIIYKLVSL